MDNIKDWLNREVNLVNNRGYTKGFYFDVPDSKDYNYDATGNDKNYFCGVAFGSNFSFGKGILFLSISS